MPSRIIREGINSSKRINALSLGAEVLYRRLLSIVDDYGRYYGSPVTIVGACWPLSPEKIRLKDLKKWLTELLRGEDPLVKAYPYGGSTFIEVQNFGQQTRARSRFPDPPWVNSAAKLESCVYFVQAQTSKKIKIGFTEVDVRARLSTLQIGSPERLNILGTFPGTLSDERATHKLFIADKISGEWFTETPELLRFIAEKCGDDASKRLENPTPSRIRSRISNADADAIDTPTVETPTEEPPPSDAGDSLPFTVSMGTKKRGKRSSAEVMKALGEERLPWWEKCWGAYPEKNGKLPAMDAFERKVHSHALAVQIYKGIVRYAERVRADPTIAVKYFQGWLNDERWTDESTSVEMIRQQPQQPTAAERRRKETLAGLELLNQIDGRTS